MITMTTMNNINSQNNYNNTNNYFNANSTSTYQSPQLSNIQSANSFQNFPSLSKRDSNNLSQVSADKAFNQAELSEEEFQKLTERRDKLLQKVFVEEESYMQNHRSHFNEMVEICKDVII